MYKDDKWHTMSGEELDSLIGFLGNSLGENTVIHIGTDAAELDKNHIRLVTCVCIHNLGHGGRVFYKSFKMNYNGVLWEKLFNETHFSLEAAVAIAESYPNYADRITVHVDANPNKLYKSSSYVKNLAGMVMGYGFSYILKPNAWASSHAADHIAKGKHRR